MSKLTGLTKRITAMLLSGMLVICSASGSVFGAETQEQQTAFAVDKDFATMAVKGSSEASTDDGNGDTLIVIIVFLGPILAWNIASKKRKNNHQTIDEEEYWAITLSAELAYLSIKNDMPEDEVILTKDCMRLYEIMGDETIPEDGRHKAALVVRSKYAELGEVRKKHDEEIKRNGTIHDKAKIIIRDCKSPFYSTKPSKRTYKEYDSSVCGVEDPFYDGLNELYPEGGLKDYLSEEEHPFISDTDIEWASKRYIKEQNFISKNCNYLTIPILIVAFQFYFIFDFLRSVQFWAYGFLVYFISIIFITMPGNERSHYNKKIFEARFKISDTLGLKRLRIADYSPRTTCANDYTYNGRSQLEREEYAAIERPVISSVKSSDSMKMTVKWRKNNNSTGYQIQYSTDKTFKWGINSVSITSASTVSKTIRGLSKGKIYYVRIRTYKIVGVIKYWSEWSSVKSVKIREYRKRHLGFL